MCLFIFAWLKMSAESRKGNVNIKDLPVILPGKKGSNFYQVATLYLAHAECCHVSSNPHNNLRADVIIILILQKKKSKLRQVE